MRIDGAATSRAVCLLCPNPGPMTLDGTNTWVLREPGASTAVVVDPGPEDGEHLERVARWVRDHGARVAAILLSHGHPDHAAGARRFAELTGAPVRAADPEFRVGNAGEDGGLADGDTVEAGGLHVRVVATPGHTPDSVSFHVPADGTVLTGDTVLGRGTTMITEDGLGDYLASLERLRELAIAEGVAALLPAHGPVRTDPVDVLDTYLRHRRERLGQVLAAVRAGDRSVSQVLARVYPGLGTELLPAARSSVRSQLRYLAARGEVPEGITEA